MKERQLSYEETLGSIRGVTGRHGKYDNEILNLLEFYDCMNISQISDYTYQNYSATARRLNQLEEYGAVSSFRDGLKCEKYYHIGKILKTHELLIRKVMFEFTKKKLTPKTNDGFKLGVELLDGEIKCDLLVSWSYKDKNYITLVEVDYTHGTSKEKIEKYERAYANGIIIGNEKRRFNLIILKQGKNKLESSIIDIIHYNFENIELDIEELTAYDI